MTIKRLTTSYAGPAGIVTSPDVVEKRWGFEHIYINGEGFDTKRISNYCMKSITINPNNETSLHFHVNKHETLLVVKGDLLLEYRDGHGEAASIVVEQGQAVIIPPGFQHRLCAQDTEVVVVEASTPDVPEDSIRVCM